MVLELYLNKAVKKCKHNPYPIGVQMAGEIYGHTFVLNS